MTTDDNKILHGADESSELAHLRDEVAQLRAENDRLRAATAPAGALPVRHRGRVILSVSLVVVASLLVPVGVIAAWLSTELTNTDRYVETVARPLVRSASVQEAATKRVTNALFERVDIQAEVAQALPERGQFLAAPITTGLRSLIQDLVARLVASSQFASLWDQANRLAHVQLVSVLTNSSDENGVVEIDLSKVAGEAGKKLAALGIPFFTSAGDKPLTFTVFQSKDLARAQSAFNLFNRLARTLPWLVILMYVGAVFAAPRRRRAVIWAGSGVIVGSAMLLTVVAVGRGLYLRALPADASLSANQLIYDTLTRFLRGGGRTVAALGLIMVIVAVAVGPSRPAVKLRQVLSTGIGRVGDEAGEHGLNTGPIGPFVHQNLTALSGAIAALAIVALVLSDRPSAGTVLWITVVAVAAAVVLEVLARSSGPAPSTGIEDLKDQIRAAPLPAAGDNIAGGVHSATPATEPTT